MKTLMEVRPLDILKILITKEQIHDVDKRNSSNEDSDVFENICMYKISSRYGR